MDELERQAMTASANYHSRLGDLAFEQGWQAAMRYARGVAMYGQMDDIDRLGLSIRADVLAGRRAG